MKDAVARHMAERGTPFEELVRLLDSDERTRSLISGESEATLNEATLLAAHFKTSLFEFIQNPNSEEKRIQ